MINNANYENILHVLINKLNTSDKEQDKEIAKNLLLNCDAICKSSIEELAIKCFTSQPTLTRYIKKLGYTDYSDFKRCATNFRQVIKTEVDSDIFAIDANKIVDKLIERNIKILTSTSETLDLIQIKKAIQRIHDAKNIVILGVDYSQIVAQDAQLRFMRYNKLMKTAVSSFEQDKLIKNLNKNDLVIFLSVSGATKNLLKVCKKVKDINTILISSTKDSLIANELDNCVEIIIGKEAHYITNSALSSRISLLTAIDSLYLYYGNEYIKTQKVVF